MRNYEVKSHKFCAISGIKIAREFRFKNLLNYRVKTRKDFKEFLLSFGFPLVSIFILQNI
jgi:hypothetical protein